MKQDYPPYKHTELCEKCLYWDSRTEERPLNAVSCHPAVAGAVWLPLFLPVHVHSDSLNSAHGSTEMQISTVGAVGQPEFLEQPEYPVIEELCSAQATPLPPGVAVPC